jgi:RNA polymerase sigma-70 factor, ECF subfamily
MGLALNNDDRAYVLAVTQRILGAREDLAADAAQDAMLAAHRHRDQFQGRSTHRTWLHRIAVVSALDKLRRQRRARLVVGDPVPDVVDPGMSPEDELAMRRLVARVSDELSSVPAAHREVFLMRAAGHSEPEVSQALGITVANVKIRTYRVRQQLRLALGAQADPGELDREGAPARAS